MAKYSTIAVHISATLLLFLAPFLLLFPIGGRVLLAGGDPAGTAPEKTQPDGAGRYLPAVGPIDYRLAGDGRGRVLAPFLLCLLCRCCAAGDPANCTSMSCCFGINCALPDKPYGVCAFVPKLIRERIVMIKGEEGRSGVGGGRRRGGLCLIWFPARVMLQE